MAACLFLRTLAIRVALTDTVTESNTAAAPAKSTKEATTFCLSMQMNVSHTFVEGAWGILFYVALLRAAEALDRIVATRHACCVRDPNRSCACVSCVPKKVEFNRASTQKVHFLCNVLSKVRFMIKRTFGKTTLLQILSKVRFVAKHIFCNTILSCKVFPKVHFIKKCTLYKKTLFMTVCIWTHVI